MIVFTLFLPSGSTLSVEALFQGYQAPGLPFFMLNSTEPEISTAHKTKMLKNEDSCFQTIKCCIYHANKCLNVNKVNIFEHDIFHAQLSYG